MPEFQVKSDEAGVRLDQYLAIQVPRLSRSRIQALIDSGDVQLNGARTKRGAKVRSGDHIVLHEPPPIAARLEAEAIPLTILFEDESLAVINKPPGLVVHPGAGNTEHTLVHALLHHCTNLSGIGGEQRPGIVHRLDRDTSGCLVVAKNDAAHQHLSRQFSGRQVLKIYLAIVAGRPRKQSGVIDVPIGRHRVHRQKMSVVEPARGRAAKTEFRVRATLPVGTLVECTLHTGRTHQIRVHLKHLGHPILGDKIYGGADGRRWPRQLLHAWKLGFFHPVSGARLEFRAAIPDDFTDAGVPADLP